MTASSTLPSPLAGEGAERRKREAGEGARPLTKAARKSRSQMIDAEKSFGLGNNDVLFNLKRVLTSLAIELGSTPHPAPRLRSPPPSPARGEGKKQEGAR